MKAAVFQGVGEDFKIEIQSDPVPGPHEVVIRVACCGICGTDLHSTSGHGDTTPTGDVIGHEFSGTIESIGSEVTRVDVGDRVTGMSLMGCGTCVNCLSAEPMWCPERKFHSAGFAELKLAGEYECVKLPPEVSFTDGALVEPLAVGLHGVRLANMPLGSKVLVMGAGTIGLCVAFWARRLGASEVVVCARTSRRAELAQRLGATRFLTVGDGFTDKITAEMGRLPDYVFECVGLEGALSQAIDLVKPRGTVMALGYCTHPDSIVPAKALFKEVNIQFSVTYSISDYQYVVDVLASGAGEVRTMVSETFPLESINQAFELARGNAGSTCKVLVAPQGK